MTNLIRSWFRRLKHKAITFSSLILLFCPCDFLFSCWNVYFVRRWDVLFSWKRYCASLTPVFVSPYWRSAEAKESIQTSIVIEKETAGLGLEIVGGSDTYLVRKLQLQVEMSLLHNLASKIKGEEKESKYVNNNYMSIRLFPFLSYLNR